MICALVMSWVKTVEGDYVLRIPLSPVEYLHEWRKRGLSCFTTSLEACAGNHRCLFENILKVLQKFYIFHGIN